MSGWWREGGAWLCGPRTCSTSLVGRTRLSGGGGRPTGEGEEPSQQGLGVWSLQQLAAP